MKVGERVERRVLIVVERKVDEKVERKVEQKVVYLAVTMAD